VSENALELVTTDEMVEELARRNVGVLLMLVSSVTDSEEVFKTWYRGGATLAIGMAARSLHRLRSDLAESKEDEE
jgi:hypothetical protein